MADPKWVTEDEARARLMHRIAQAGSADALAREVGCSPSLISYALGGTKPIGPTLAKALGLIAAPVKTYRYLDAEPGR